MAGKVVGFPRRATTGKRSSKSKPIKLDPAKKGSLHTALGIPQGQPIPMSRINAELRKASGNLKQKLVFAKNARGFKH